MTSESKVEDSQVEVMDIVVGSVLKILLPSAALTTLNSRRVDPPEDSSVAEA